MDNDEGLALLSYDDEAMAQRVCTYLVKELVYCNHMKAQVFENNGQYAYRSQYIIGVRTGGAYWKTFSTSISRVTDAAHDFVAGYRAAGGK